MPALVQPNRNQLENDKITAQFWEYSEKESFDKVMKSHPDEEGRWNYAAEQQNYSFGKTSWLKYVQTFIIWLSLKLWSKLKNVFVVIIFSFPVPDENTKEKTALHIREKLCVCSEKGYTVCGWAYSSPPLHTSVLENRNQFYIFISSGDFLFCTLYIQTKYEYE